MNRNNTLLEFDSHEFQNAMQRKGLSLRETAKLTGIDRKTLYNAMLTGKVTYRTAKMLDAAHLAKFDMVNVIRCKDCKHYCNEDENYISEEGFATTECIFMSTATENDFCSRAERKEE